MHLHTLLFAFVVAPAAIAADDPKVALNINVDDAAGIASPCRIHLHDANGKAVQPTGYPFWRDHFVCAGRATLQLPPGKYHYEIERGPEHMRLNGDIDLKGEQTLKLQLKRFADLSKGGWYSGDLHIHRPTSDIELLMRAENLYVGPVITWWNQRNLWAGRDVPRAALTKFDGNRLYDVMGGEDERGGGALLFFHLSEPLAITKAAREFPSPLMFVEEARKKNKNVWIDVEKPFWWDAPTWIASGKVDSIGIANNHMCRSQMYPGEAWGKARDEKRLPPPMGNGQWTQEIYYHVLNCGFRIPPSAGSASGVLPNPVGYNRVYVQVEGELTWDKWWAGLKAGRSFVTNGPLLRATANGKAPGAILSAPGRLEVQIDMSLDSLDNVTDIEIIRDGKVVSTIKAGARNVQANTSISFAQSGWFLVRAVSDNDKTFRFASTAPFYVEIGKDKSRISKKSAMFFKDWTDERIERLRAALKDEQQLAEVLKPHAEAKRVWQALIDRANAD
jgi:hypothetical protein